jgi:hypothetical protein
MFRRVASNRSQMNAPPLYEIDPRIQAAVAELQDLIRSRFPEATFTVGVVDDPMDDPQGVYMRAIMDVDDTDDVTDVFMDRLLDMQVDEGLPIYVVSVHPPERIAADLRKRQQAAALTP